MDIDHLIHAVARARGQHVSYVRLCYGETTVDRLLADLARVLGIKPAVARLNYLGQS